MILKPYTLNHEPITFTLISIFFFVFFFITLKPRDESIKQLLSN